INIVEIKKVDLDAKLVADNIARQLENRISFRRAQKQAIQRAMRGGAKGVRTLVSGRLGGADIARSEGYSEGTVPLHTLDRKSTRLNSSHVSISYAVFCLKKKN